MVQSRLFPLVSFEAVALPEVNRLLLEWGHKMGPCKRGNRPATCHALFHGEEPVAVTVVCGLIRPNVGGGCDWMTRANTVELARLCASRTSLCRVALRLWREFVFPSFGADFAVSYQDADLHTGNTYRFDGWKRVGYSHSGFARRSQGQGRDKWIWVWCGEGVSVPEVAKKGA